MNLHWLTIELTTKCDLHCKHCFALAALDSKNSISFERAKDIVMEGYLSGFRKLHFTGGEPTLWKDFFRLLDYSFEIGYESLFFNTHGGHLTREYSSRLAVYGERIGLTISLNGDQSLHDSVRGEGAYEMALFGIRNALDAGLSVELFVVVGKKLLQSLPDFTDRMFRMFPNMHRMTWIQLHRVEEDYYDVKEDLLTPGEFIEMVRMAALLRLYGYPMYILDNSLSNVAANEIGLPHLPHSPNIESSGRFVVLVDGKITNSHSSRKEFGMFGPGIFQKILNSKDYKRRTEEDAVICTSCTYLHTCRKAGNPRPSLPSMDDLSEPYCKRVLGLLEEAKLMKR